MAITDPPIAPTPGISEATNQVRQAVVALVNQSEQSLKNIKAIIDANTRVSINTELNLNEATDGADLTTVYNLFKTALNDALLNTGVPAIPL